jgi:hypothetical protein
LSLGVPVLSRPLAVGFAILVATMWAASIAAALIWPERYDISTELNTIFMIVAGAVLGLTPKREQVAAARRVLARRRGEEPEQTTSPADADPDGGPDSTTRGDSP